MILDKRILIDLQYFPSLEYFVALQNARQITFEAFEYYEKQSYRNRCYVLGANKILQLTVPVLNGNSKVIVKDIKIDHDQKWLGLHWKTITSAYGKSPFFMYYGDYIREILYKKHKYLFDLNTELLFKLLDLLGLKLDISFTSQYSKDGEEDKIDMRSVIHPKIDYQLNGLYIPCRYNQVFGIEFVDNLSILDILFCEGNNAGRILKKSSKQQLLT